MNILDLPIVADETLKDRTRAFIHKSKIVCHPDLVEKVIEGMALMKASAEGFERDMAELTKKLEKENEIREQTNDAS